MSKYQERIILPFVLSNKNGGRSSHWGSSAKERKSFESKLRILGFKRTTPLPFPVEVVVTRILGPKMSKWDSSSCGRGNYKELEDALVACGWFQDDSIKYITNTDFRQDDTRRKGGAFV